MIKDLGADMPERATVKEYLTVRTFCTDPTRSVLAYEVEELLSELARRDEEIKRLRAEHDEAAELARLEAEVERLQATIKRWLPQKVRP